MNIAVYPFTEDIVYGTFVPVVSPIELLIRLVIMFLSPLPGRVMASSSSFGGWIEHFRENVFFELPATYTNYFA